MEKSKRKYERINPEDHARKPPPIIYQDGKVVDRRAYDKWYSAHKRNYRTETQEQKNARYKRYSETYWRRYCLENGLDPENWFAVSENEKRLKRIRNWQKRHNRAWRW